MFKRAFLRLPAFYLQGRQDCESSPNRPDSPQAADYDLIKLAIFYNRLKSDFACRVPVWSFIGEIIRLL